MEKFITRMFVRWAGIICLLCDILVFVLMIVLLGLAVIFAMIFNRKSLKDIWNDGEIAEWLHLERNIFRHSIKAILTGENPYEMDED